MDFYFWASSESCVFPKIILYWWRKDWIFCEESTHKLFLVLTGVSNLWSSLRKYEYFLVKILLFDKIKGANCHLIATQLLLSLYACR